MERITLNPTTGRSVTFTGEQIGKAHNNMDRASGYWSGETGRETRLRLYRTAKGKLVSYRHNVTCWDGERDSVRVAVHNTVDELVAHLGTGYLAVELYDDAELDISVDLDAGESPESQE